jgi:uncharacterized protein
MAKQLLFIHGAGGGAYAEDADLAQSLRSELGSDYQVRYPEMPNEEDPDYDTWKRLIRDEARDLGERAILVGHSIGASVLIKMLTEPGSKPRIAGAFCVAAPFWHDDAFWCWDEVKLSSDAAENWPRATPLFLYHGEKDKVPIAHLDMYAAALPMAVVRRLPGRDHQLNGDMTEIARDIEGLG